MLLYVHRNIGLLGTGAQDGHLDFHTAPAVSCILRNALLFQQLCRTKSKRQNPDNKLLEPEAKDCLTQSSSTYLFGALLGFGILVQTAPGFCCTCSDRSRILLYLFRPLQDFVVPVQTAPGFCCTCSDRSWILFTCSDRSRILLYLFKALMGCVVPVRTSPGLCCTF